MLYSHDRILAIECLWDDTTMTVTISRLLLLTLAPVLVVRWILTVPVCSSSASQLEGVKRILLLIDRFLNRVASNGPILSRGSSNGGELEAGVVEK